MTSLPSSSPVKSELMDGEAAGSPDRQTRKSPTRASQEKWNRVLEEVRPMRLANHRFLYSNECSREELLEHIPMEIQNMFGAQGFWNCNPGNTGAQFLTPVVIYGPQHVNPDIRGRWGQNFNQIQKTDGDLLKKLKVIVWKYGASPKDRYALIERKHFIPFKQANFLVKAEDLSFIKGLSALEDDTKQWSIDKNDAINRYHIALDEASWIPAQPSSKKRKVSSPNEDRILKRSQCNIQHLVSFVENIDAESEDIAMIREDGKNCSGANYIVIVKMMQFLHDSGITTQRIVSYINHLLSSSKQMQIDPAVFPEPSEHFISSLEDESIISESLPFDRSVTSPEVAIENLGQWLEDRHSNDPFDDNQINIISDHVRKLDPESMENFIRELTGFVSLRGDQHGECNLDLRDLPASDQKKCVGILQKSYGLRLPPRTERHPNDSVRKCRNS